MTPNVLTVDVEDWYHDADGLADRPVTAPRGRVGENLRRLLDLLDELGGHATFFVLGELAEHEPALVAEIVRRGHEVGSHGFRHRPLAGLLRREFREDVRRSRETLEQTASSPVTGFRAPYFSIKAGVRWPLEVVRESGFQYDSSVLPIDRAPGLEVVSPVAPYRAPGVGIWEVPVSVARVLAWNLPLFGGAALRLLPAGFLERELDRFRRRHGPAVLHLHPWELDPEGPESAAVPAAIRAFKRIGRRRLPARLRRLGGRYGLTSIREAFPEIADPARTPSR